MSKPKAPKNTFDKYFGLLIDIVIVFVCLIAAFLLYYIISSQIHSNDPGYRPKIGIYTIVSPSMDPVIKVYDVVINKRVTKPEQIQIGDIITYVSTNANSEGMTITHRVIEINKTDDNTYEFRTQGDNNPEPDNVYVTFDNVLGKEIMIIPKLGRLQFLLANKKGWLFLLLIPVLIYIFIDIYKLITLLGLNQKVEQVIKPVETEDIQLKKKKEEIRKAVIKRELNLSEPKIEFVDEYQKSNKEPMGFLDSYNETTFSVGEIKETKIEPVAEEKQEKPRNIAIIATENAIVSPLIANEITMKTKEEIEVEDIPEEPTEDIQEITKEIPQKPITKETPKVINENIEILDTDELSSTIKKYTEKISELNSQIAALDKLHREEEERIEKAEKEARQKVIEEEKNKKTKAKELKESPQEDLKPVVEKDNYLKGSRIKVVNQESAKRPPKKETQDKKPIEKIELKSASLYNRTKTIKKMERPKGVDIKTLNKDINPVKKTEPLQKVEPIEPIIPVEPVILIEPPKKVETPKVEEPKKKTGTKKRLNLKPNTIKKINRSNKKAPTKNNNRKRVVAKTKGKKLATPKKKEKFIRIVKTK